MRRLIDRMSGAIVGALALALVAVLAGLADAGPLDPGGPPGSTPGVLRPGTPIRQPASAAGFPIVLSQPGSYYLVQNITGVSGKSAIQVAASNIEIDLAGFTLAGVPGSIDGITDNSVSVGSVRVHGGTVSDFGDVGIDLRASPNSQIYDVSVLRNVNAGIEVDSGTVSDCLVVESPAAGAVGIRTWGPTSVVEGCTTRGYGTGIALNSGGTLRNCQVFDAETTGIYLQPGASVTDCHIQNIGSGNSNVIDTGILANGQVVIERNFIADVASQAGMAGAQLDGGVWVSGTGSVVRHNTFESVGQCSWVRNGSGSSIYANSVSLFASTCGGPAIGANNFVGDFFKANDPCCFNSALSNVWH